MSTSSYFDNNVIRKIKRNNTIVNTMCALGVALAFLGLLVGTAGSTTAGWALALTGLAFGILSIVTMFVLWGRGSGEEDRQYRNYRLLGSPALVD